MAAVIQTTGSDITVCVTNSNKAALFALLSSETLLGSDSLATAAGVAV